MTIEITKPAMHTDFPQWYASISIGEDEKTRQARWDAITTIVSSANRAIIEALIRIALSTRQKPDEPSLEVIREAFKATDQAFQTNGNDRELKVLAAICLAILMDRGGTSGAVACLMTLTALACIAKPNLPMDLGLLARNARSELSNAARRRGQLYETMSAALPVTVPDVLDEASTLATIKSVAAAVDSTSRHLRSLQALLRVQDEELQMLWWLIGQRSWDLECTFDAIPRNGQPLVFAKELADATHVLPGPLAIDALLSRAGLKDSKGIVIADAINSMKSDWLQSIMKWSDISPVSAPIHYAIKRQLETGPGDAWIAGWAAVTGVPETLELKPLALGDQFYNERVLLMLA